jgi:tetratricopeptide (TPR) repeat protein
VTQHKQDSFSIHPLVHLWARKRLDPEQEQQLVKKAVFMLALALVMNESEFECDQILRKRIANHVEVCSDQAQSLLYSRGSLSSVDSLDYVWPAMRIGYFYRKQGRYEKALDWYKNALACCGSLRENDVCILDVQYGFANVLLDKRQYDEAIERYNKVLDGYKRQLGRHHESTLNTANNIGLAYQGQGKYPIALEYLRFVLSDKRRVLGPTHRSTLDTLANVAHVYRRLGNNEKAQEHYLEALAGYSTELGGRNNLSWIETAENIALTCTELGQYGQGLQYYRDALEPSRHVRGPEDPSTIEIMRNLGLTYSKQGNITEAFVWCESSLAEYTRLLGEQHQSTLETVSDLGNLHYKNGEHARALELYCRASPLELEDMLGPNHATVLNIIHNTACIFMIQREYEAALQKFERAIAGYEVTRGPNHLSTINAVFNRCTLHLRMGSHILSLVDCQRALSGYERALGPDHERTQLARKILHQLGQRGFSLVDPGSQLGHAVSQQLDQSDSRGSSSLQIFLVESDGED